MQAQQPIYYYNNQGAYPMTPGGQPVPPYGPYPGVPYPVPIQRNPQTIVIQKPPKDETGKAAAAGCCAGICVACTTMACCCLMAQALKH